MADDDNKPNPAEAFQRLLEKNNNDGVKLASQLFDENFQLRAKNRELGANVPKDGALTLTADEAKKWKAYEDLGVDASEIKTSLEKLPTLEAENLKLSKRDKLRDIEVLGYDLELLEDQMSKFPTAELTVKITKDAKDATKEVKTPFVTIDGKESSLDDFGETHFPKILPVLKVNADQPPKPGNGGDPKPHKMSADDVMKNELSAQAASGRYTL